MYSLKLTFTDFIILFLTAAITVFFAVRIYAKSDSALQFVIQGKNGSWVYPVNQAVLLDIPGPLGIMVVEIKDGSARIIASPCANQTCVTSGSVQHRGQWAACLPNAVFVHVESNDIKQTDRRQDAGLDGAVW